MGSEGNEVTKDLERKSSLFTLKIPKGRLDGELQINMFDVVRDCPGKDCELSNKCPYSKSKKESEPDKTYGQCTVEMRYVQSQMAPLMSLLSVVKDEIIMQWVGFHLIPMYVDLIQLKLEKLKLDSLFYSDDKGKKYAHPVFDQMLKLHKEIINLWKSTGLLKIAKEAGFFEVGGKIIQPDDADLEIEGDGEWYEAMSQSTGKKGK